MSTRLRRKISPSISTSRWAAYATAGVATGVSFATSADAAIVHVDVNQRVQATSAGSLVTFPFTLAGNAANFLSFAHYNFGGGLGVGLFFIGGAVSAGFIGVANGNFRYVGKLAYGQQINGGAFVTPVGNNFGTLASKGGFTNSKWKSAGTGYIGFEFNAGTGTQFGWARITVDGVSGNAFTVLDYAYGGVGESIKAGQIPEPGSLALLALGGGGLLFWRQRRSRVAMSA